MRAIDLLGRRPVVVSAISSRLLAVVVGIFLVVVAAVVFGFHYRFKKQEQRRQAVEEQGVASDAATSNRQSVEGEVPVSSLRSPPTGQSAARPGPSAMAAPFVDAAKTVAHPFPDGPVQQATAQQSQSVTASAIPWYPQPQLITSADPKEELRKQKLAHQYAREQQAFEGPTGAEQQNPGTTSPRDPAQAELDRLNDVLRGSQTAALSPSGASAVKTDAVPAQQEQGAYKLQNGQGEKRQFGEGGEGVSEDYLKTTRTPPLSRWVVQRGTVIPATLPHKLVSDLPGDLIAEVARDVYDSPTQKYVMIPAGSRLIGEYNSSVTYAQNRAQVVWTAIYFPDGSFVDLDRMPSHAADGSVGLKDQANNHYKRLIAGVALSSVFAAGLQLSQNRTNGSVLQYPSTGQVLAGAVGTQAAELGNQLTSRNLNIQPTLKIRPGQIFSVSVKKDMLFPGPYEPVSAK